MYRMMDRVKPQLNELLLGFFDVIPEPLLTIFDFQELELLMCGLPMIDMKDWIDNTEYSGEYEQVGLDYPTCQWFWEVVEEFDQELRARLLQFVTGTSGVPARGFGVLQGNDGNIRRFTIHGVPVGVCLYPRSHTCFNRIDLPMYETKEELHEKLKLAVTMVATGFDLGTCEKKPTPPCAPCLFVSHPPAYPNLLHTQSEHLRSFLLVLLAFLRLLGRVQSS
jgi:E3 ubiquitin-protein ligase NEDD4